MTSKPNEPTINDVLTPTEEPHPDHNAHAKTPRHVSDAELDERTEHERSLVDADQDE